MYSTLKVTALTITLYESAARYHVIWFNVVFGIGQSIKSINQSNKSIILPVHSSICIFIYHQTSQKTDQTLDCGASCVTAVVRRPSYLPTIFPCSLLDASWFRLVWNIYTNFCYAFDWHIGSHASFAPVEVSSNF